MNFIKSIIKFVKDSLKFILFCCLNKSVLTEHDIHLTNLESIRYLLNILNIKTKDNQTTNKYYHGISGQLLHFTLVGECYTRKVGLMITEDKYDY